MPNVLYKERGLIIVKKTETMKIILLDKYLFVSMLFFSSVELVLKNVHIESLYSILNGKLELSIIVLRGLSVIGGVGCFLVFFLVNLFELIQRFNGDKVSNFIYSIKETFLLHRFLKKIDNGKQLMSDSNSVVTRVFNKAVNKSLIDIREDSITVYIKFPRQYQAQKILSDVEEQLKEYIANIDSDYYISAPIRERRGLFFFGKRR